MIKNQDFIVLNSTNDEFVSENLVFVDKQWIKSRGGATGIQGAWHLYMKPCWKCDF